MSKLIRLGAGLLSADTILNDSSYLVTNFPRLADMVNRTHIYWLAYQHEQPATTPFHAGAELGSGIYEGGVSGLFRFAVLSEDMRQHIHNTIMGGRAVAQVTIYFLHDVDGFQVYQGELVSPFQADSDLSYNRVSDDYYTEVTYRFRRGTQVSSSFLLLENSDYVLLETGDKLVLE